MLIFRQAARGLPGVPDLKRNKDTEGMLAMTREYEQERIKRLYGERK